MKITWKKLHSAKSIHSNNSMVLNRYGCLQYREYCVLATLIFVFFLLIPSQNILSQQNDSLSQARINAAHETVSDQGADTTQSTPFEYQMKVGARNELYNANGIDERRARRTTLFDLVGSASNNEMNFQWEAHLSTEDLTSAQAVDNISILAEIYKLGKMTVGDIIPKYTEYGLNGIMVRGVDAQMHHGLFQLQVTSGITQRAVEGDTGILSDGTYMRYLAAGKLSVGDEKSFITNLSITKVKDKNESITLPGHTRPQESLVGSFDYLWNMMDGKLKWYAEANVADHTRNTGSEEYKDEVKLFGTPIFRTRLSSRISMAFMSALDWKLTDAAIALKYKRVQPGYTSLGTVRTDNDYEEINADARYSLFQRGISARSMVSYRHDNLDDMKIATSGLLRVLQTGYFHLSRSFTFSISYSLFLDKDNNTNDTLTFARNGLTHAFSWSPMITFGSPTFFNRLYGLISLNILKNGEGANNQLNYDNYNFMLSYGCNIGSSFASTISNSHVKMLQAAGILNINTSEFIIEPMFFQQKLKTKFRTAFSYTSGRVEPVRHWETGLGFDFRFNDKETISLQLRQTWHNPNGVDAFSEFRWWLNYQHDIL